MKEKYCKKCNQEYDAEKTYCPVCGALLLEKEKEEVNSQENEEKKDDESIWVMVRNEYLIPQYEPVAKKYLLPLIVIMGIIEAVAVCVALQVGIAKAFTDSFRCLIISVLIMIGVEALRKWTICEYGGNSEMLMFGVKESTMKTCENVMKIVYPMIVIFCSLACLRYIGVAYDIIKNLFDAEFKGIEYQGFEMELLLLIYKIKDWIMLSICTTIVYETSKIYHKVEEKSLKFSIAALEAYRLIKQSQKK